MSYAGDITPQQAWDLLAEDPDAVLVDVRTDREWQVIGVPDTTSIERRTLFIEWTNSYGERNPDFIDELKAAGLTGPVVFLCRSGNRSVGAATVATAAGIAPSYNVLEGFEGRFAPGWKSILPWKEQEK